MKQSRDKIIENFVDHFTRTTKDKNIIPLAKKWMEDTLAGYDQSIIKMVKKLKSYHPDYGKHMHIFIFENKGKCTICGMSWKKTGEEEIYNNALDQIIKSLQE